SSANHGVFTALTRSTTGFVAKGSQLATAALAASFASGATASSRSMITRSAPLANALSKRSGRSAGTKRYERGTVRCSAITPDQAWRHAFHAVPHDQPPANASKTSRQTEHVLGDIRQDKVGRDGRDLVQPCLPELAFDVVFVRE